MIPRLYQANELGGGIPADKTIESRMRPDKKGWIYGFNLSPFVFEIQNETGNPETIALPFSPFVHPLSVRSEKLILHGVAQKTAAPPIPASQFAVYVTVSEFSPRLTPTALTSSDQGLPAANTVGSGWIVRIQDGATAILASITAEANSDAGAGFFNELAVAPHQRVFNGASWDRQRSASAANLAAQSGLAAALVAPPGSWSVVSAPAAGSQATASRAAGGAGVRHVYRSALITWGAIAAPVATLLQGNVRDGATGAGTVIDTGQLPVPAAVFQGPPLHMGPDKGVPGSAATAMTAEGSAALANLAEGASLQGYDAS